MLHSVSVNIFPPKRWGFRLNILPLGYTTVDLTTLSQKRQGFKLCILQGSSKVDLSTISHQKGRNLDYSYYILILQKICTHIPPKSQGLRLHILQGFHSRFANIFPPKRYGLRLYILQGNITADLSTYPTKKGRDEYYKL